MSRQGPEGSVGQGRITRSLETVAEFGKKVADALGKPTDQQIVQRFLDRGISTVVSVPCSVTATMDAQWQDLASVGRMSLIKAVNEHSLPGIATGFYLGAGETALIHMQNSGFTNQADPIVSFATVYGVPLLEMVTWRGSNEKDDSSPHQAIGKITDRLTKEVAGVKNVFGDQMGRGILRAIEQAVEHTNAGGISVIRLSPDAFEKTYQPTAPDIIEEPDEDYEYRNRLIWTEKGSIRADVLKRPRISREEAVKEIVRTYPDAAIIWSNGFNARGALAHGDRVGNFYNAGYMGGSLAIGWGLAQSNPDMKVVVVDGDQNSMMGVMQPLLAADYPDNLNWVILDNGIGASVGTSKSVPLPPEIYWRARVIRTIQDGLPGEFKAPRIDLIDQYFDTDAAKELAQVIGPLPTHTLRFKKWVEQETRVNRAHRLGQRVSSQVDDVMQRHNFT